MKRVICIVSGAVLTASVAFAQAPAQGRVGIAAGLQNAYSQARNNVVGGLEKVPEADYGFKPTPDVRSYGAIFTHIADAHYQICAAAKGVPNPMQGVNLEQTRTTKADIVKALNDSFTFCDDAFSTLTDETAGQFIANGRGGETARGAVLLNVIAHDNEMYGISTVYQRLKGAVPPSSDRTGRGRGGPGRGPAAPPQRGN
jgi:uncharacterized damage-inducible protein DinB